MVRNLLKSILNILLMPYLRQLGFQNVKKLRGRSLQSHFYKKINEAEALASICNGYLKKSGWIDSQNYSMCRDEHGLIPWFTYPSIHFLRDLELEDKQILEFGAGGSTIYFSKRCKTIISFESDDNYLLMVFRELPIETNIQLNSYPKQTEIINPILGFDQAMEIESTLGDHANFLANMDFKKFKKEVAEILTTTDIVIIDGGPRYLIAQLCLESIRRDTLIIVDNTDRAYENNIRILLVNSGYLEIPFHGLGPLNPYAWTTSVFISRESTDKWMLKKQDFQNLYT